MTIARLTSGELVVHGAVACDDATMVAIDALGPVRWIVVPNGFHRMDAPAYAARYPEAKVVTPGGATRRVAEVCRVDGGLDALPADRALSWAPCDGIPAEAVLIHRAGPLATVILNDAFMNLPAKLPGFKGWVVKALGSTGGPKVTRTAKLGLVKDKAAWADHLRRLAATPGLTRVIPGHGAVIRDAAAAAAGLARAGDGLHR